MLQSVNPLPHHHPNPNSLASLTASHNDGYVHLLLAASGSVATIKIPQILSSLSSHHASRLRIRVLLTSSASPGSRQVRHHRPLLGNELDPCVLCIAAAPRPLLLLR